MQEFVAEASGQYISLERHISVYCLRVMRRVMRMLTRPVALILITLRDSTLLRTSRRGCVLSALRRLSPVIATPDGRFLGR